MTNAISIMNLCKRFHDYVAVDNVSFEIPYGQVTALLGSNGAGKSTTLNMIAGIIRPSAGEIVIAGETYQKNYKLIKSKLGYLTADMALYDSFSIYETFHVLGELKGYQSSFIESRISELTKYFGINELLQHHYNELSSGQKQRALICASVFHDPQILIFDEVTASLDIVNAKNIMDFLKSEKDKGKAILFSTHILSEVEYLSDRILVIEKGQMMQETNYRELMSSTQKNNITDAFYHVLKKSL